MEQFFTAKLHSKAQKLHLSDPFGEITDQYLMIIGPQSEAVRKADQQARLKIVYADDADRDKALKEAKLEITAAMIESWSFDEEPTTENKINFLEEAPQIADSVDLFGSNHENFAKK